VTSGGGSRSAGTAPAGTAPARTAAAAAILIVLLAIAAAHAAARSWDLWWHLETGEQIAASASVPRADDFSFTSRGVPWTDHEWLFQLLMHWAWTALGPPGLALLKWGAAFAAALTGYVALRRAGAGAGLGLTIVALCIVGLRFRLTERPELATIAMAPAVAALTLSLAGRPSKPLLRLLALASLAVLWVNMHAGALLAPLLAVACALGAAAGMLRRGSGHGPAGLDGLGATSLAALVTALALLVNPYGGRIYAVPLEIARALAPQNLLNPEWVSPPLLKFPFLYVVVAGCAALAFAALRAGDPGSCARVAMLVVTSALALWSVRHIGVFYAILPVVLFPAALRPAGRRVPMLAGCAVGAAAGVFMFLVPPGGAQSGFGIASSRFPEAAADFVAGHLGDARLYNDVRFGGYLIWRGYPERRVFIDGRNEVHARLLADLAAALDDARLWDELLDRHGVEGAVVGYRDEAVRLQDGSVSTFSQTHFPKRKWALAHWDDVAMVFVRREGRFADLAAARDSSIQPEAFRLGLGKPEQPSASTADEAILNEIIRKLADDPDCTLAKSMASVYGIGESIPTPERGRTGSHAPGSPP